MSHQLTVGQTTSQQNHDTYVWGSEGGKGTTPQPLSEEDCQYEIAWQWGVDPLYALSAQILLLGGKNLIIGVEKSGEECRAAGCQSVWRPPVTLRTTPPHFYTSLPSLHTFYMCLPHFYPSYDSARKTHEAFLGQSPEKMSFIQSACPNGWCPLLISDLWFLFLLLLTYFW